MVEKNTLNSNAESKKKINKESIKLKDLIKTAVIRNTDDKFGYRKKSFNTKDKIYLSEYSAEENYIPFASDYVLINGKLDDEIQHYLNTESSWICQPAGGMYGDKIGISKVIGKRAPVRQLLRDGYNKRTILSMFTHEDSGWGDLEEFSWGGIVRPTSLNSSFCPVLRLDAERIKRLGLYDKLFKYKKVLNFGEYPQSEIKFKEGFDVNKLKKTGKYYFGYLKNNGDFEKNYEYQYNNQKYVKVVDRYNETHWLKVEPINWMILKRTDDYVEIRTLGALLSGIPFNLKGDNTQDIMWQNSLIRAYLNGYDIHNEIKNGNGVKEFSTELNYNFTKHSFIDEAFDINATELINENKTIEVPKSNYAKYSYNEQKALFSYLSTAIENHFSEVYYDDDTENYYDEEDDEDDYDEERKIFKQLLKGKWFEQDVYDVVREASKEERKELDYDKKACDRAYKKMLLSQQTKNNSKNNIENNENVESL